MKLSVNDISNIIQAEISGDPLFSIEGVSSFDDAGPHDITFACDSKYLTRLERTKAGAVIVPDSFVLDESLANDTIILKTENPKLSFFKLVSVFHPVKDIAPNICPTANIGQFVKFGKDPVVGANVCIGDNVSMGDNVHIMPGVYIGDNVSIGDHTRILPNVTILEKTKIGHNVVISSGTVIGSDGFGFAQSHDKHEKLIHTGHVDIGDNVEIGAANTIDRGTLGTTIIGNGVKTDNLVHIAHNVKIGDNTLVVAQVGIAGSAQIGKNVIIAGKAGITGHIKIGDGSIVGPYAGVHSDVEQNQIVSGIPHMPHGRWRKVVNVVSRLPELRKKLFSFEKRLKDLETRNMKRS